MLSKENKEKLVLTGLYKCQPNKKYRGQLYWNDMYHCFNWTFKVRYLKDDDIYLMVDTYFNEKCIELTDENFDEFEFLFDFNEVHEHSGNNIWEYNEDEYWHVAVDSRGWYLGGKYFVKNNAVKNKEKVLQRIKEEIYNLERQLKSKKADYERVQNDEVNLDYI